MVKVKVSHTIDEELVIWLESEISTKRFGSMSHGIEYALTMLKGNQFQTKQTLIKGHESYPEIISDPISLEAMRQKWWDEKQIGIAIEKTGGLGVVNIGNIVKKNVELFETKEEAKAWLNNKIKTTEPQIEKEIPEKIPAKTPHKPRPKTTSSTEPPKFTPNRSTIKCPGCGEEQLEIPGSPVKKCVNCGYIKPEDNTKHLPDQHVPAQDVPPSPPPEACQ